MTSTNKQTSYVGGYNKSQSQVQLPVGTIIPVFGDFINSDYWLLCNGQTYDIEKFPQLYQFLSNHPRKFYRNQANRTPNFQNRFLRSQDYNQTILDPTLMNYPQSQQLMKHTHNLRAATPLNSSDQGFIATNSVQDWDSIRCSDRSGIMYNANVNFGDNEQPILPYNYFRQNAPQQIGDENQDGLPASDFNENRPENVWINYYILATSSSNQNFISPFLQTNLNLNNFRLTNLSTPIDNKDAVTKQYVDGLFASASEIRTGSEKVTTNDGKIQIYIGNQLFHSVQSATNFSPSLVSEYNTAHLFKNSTNTNNFAISYGDTNGLTFQTQDLDMKLALNQSLVQCYYPIRYMNNYTIDQMQDEELITKSMLQSEVASTFKLISRDLNPDFNQMRYINNTVQLFAGSGAQEIFRTGYDDFINGNSQFLSNMPDDSALKKQFMLLPQTRITFQETIFSDANSSLSLYAENGNLVLSNASRRDDGYLLKWSNTLNSNGKNFVRHNIEIANPSNNISNNTLVTKQYVDQAIIDHSGNKARILEFNISNETGLQQLSNNQLNVYGVNQTVTANRSFELNLSNINITQNIGDQNELGIDLATNSIFFSNNQSFIVDVQYWLTVSGIVWSGAANNQTGFFSLIKEQNVGYQQVHTIQQIPLSNGADFAQLLPNNFCYTISRINSYDQQRFKLILWETRYTLAQLGLCNIRVKITKIT